jgi:hypothetical protein
MDGGTLVSAKGEVRLRSRNRLCEVVVGVGVMDWDCDIGMANSHIH